MKQMGKKIIRDEVAFILDRLYKKRDITYTYVCDGHNEEIGAKPIRCAASSKASIQRRFARSSVLVEVFHQKFVLNFSCYHQVSEWNDTDYVWVIKYSQTELLLLVMIGYTQFMLDLEEN